MQRMREREGRIGKGLITNEKRRGEGRIGEDD